MMRAVLRQFMFRYGWDTRCRNRAVSALIQSRLAHSGDRRPFQLLDVGAGAQGIAVFVPGVTTLSVDIVPVAERAESNFAAASATSLPFRSRSFPIVTCVDVLEHLSPETRDDAIAEMLRVADDALILACPIGAVARRSDESFRQASVAHGRPIPSWVGDHQRNVYPELESVLASVRRAARDQGRSVNESIVYNEPVALNRAVRHAAATSNVLYTAVNLGLSLVPSALGQPGPANAYRAIFLLDLRA